MKKKTENMNEIELAALAKQNSFNEAIRKHGLAMKELSRAGLRSKQPGMEIETNTSKYRAIKHVKGAALEAGEGMKDILAVGLAESIRPSVAGEGSDTLPKDEQKKKDEFNRKARMAQAISNKK